MLDGTPALPGARCGACGDGTTICMGPEVLACVAASSASTCRDGGSLADATGSDSSPGIAEPNACGGMGPLLWRGVPNALGGSCGASAEGLKCASSIGLVCGGPDLATIYPDAGPNDTCDIPISVYAASGPTLPAPPSEPAPLATTAISLALAANALVYNPFDLRLYASVSSRQGADGNSIAVIDPYTGTVVKSIFVGSEPTRMALSDDGKSLWVVLDGAASLRQVDLVSGTAGQQFSLGSHPIFGAWYAIDVATLPGAPDSVVVTRYSKSSSAKDGPVVYDNGVPRAYSAGTDELFADLVVATYSPRLVFAIRSGLGTISTACVNGNGLFIKHSAAPFIIPLDQVAFVRNVIYSGSGVAYDIASGNTLGTYAGRGPVAADASKRRVYFLSDTKAATVSAYDMDTFLPIGSETLTVGTSIVGRNLVLWGAYGYAFRTDLDLVIIARSALRAAGGDALDGSAGNDSSAGDNAGDSPSDLAPPDPFACSLNSGERLVIHIVGTPPLDVTNPADALCLSEYLPGNDDSGASLNFDWANGDVPFSVIVRMYDAVPGQTGTFAPFAVAITQGGDAWLGLPDKCHVTITESQLIGTGARANYKVTGSMACDAGWALNKMDDVLQQFDFTTNVAGYP